MMQHLQHVQALLRVALESSDFVKLPTDTVYDFLSVIADKVDLITVVHDEVLALNYQDRQERD